MKWDENRMQGGYRATTHAHEAHNDALLGSEQASMLRDAQRGSRRATMMKGRVGGERRPSADPGRRRVDSSRDTLHRPGPGPSSHSAWPGPCTRRAGRRSLPVGSRSGRRRRQARPARSSAGSGRPGSSCLRGTCEPTGSSIGCSSTSIKRHDRELAVDHGHGQRVADEDREQVRGRVPGLLRAPRVVAPGSVGQAVAEVDVVVETGCRGRELGARLADVVHQATLRLVDGDDRGGPARRAR